jgi:hypothetical protein
MASLGKHRASGGGLLLLVLLAILLAAPLWRHRDIDHPLASRQALDVCPLLPAWPATLGIAGSRPGTGRCELVDASGGLVLGIGLSSQRSMAAGSSRGGTRPMYDTWLKEVRASGAVDVREEPGPWRAASSYTLGSHRDLLIDDGGLLIVLSSPRLGPEAMRSYAEALAPALRSR